ncbi:sigma-70 family RNA polymerase sigma factor [Allobranchiibius sp. GilTou38]|nr:sigma-70 family RNA polymerase sigma factor [Allobranchiibius sp. GilTou38]
MDRARDGDESWAYEGTTTEELLTQARRAPEESVAKALRAIAVERNAGLTRSIARRYAGRGVETEDLVQVAALALVLAASRFDPQRGSAFSAYARITIAGELKRHLRDHAWAVRPPRALHDAHFEIAQAAQDLTQSLGAMPTRCDIAVALHTTVDQVRKAQEVASSFSAASLDVLLVERPDRSPGGELNVGSVGSVDALVTRMALQEGVRSLDPRDQLILRLRFEEDLTQIQIGRRVGLSQMQVSRRLAAIVKLLRTSLTGADGHQLSAAG